MASSKPSKTKDKELSTNNYLAVLAIITVLVVVLSAYFSYTLIKQNILNGKVIRGKLQAQSDINKKVNAANALVKNYQGLSDSQRQLIASAIPNTEDFPQLVALIENASANAGIQFIGAGNSDSADTGDGSDDGSSDTAAPATSDLGSGTYDFTATIEGNYPSITKWFQNLEISTRPIVVTGFSLNGETGDLKGDVNLKTYFQPAADLNDSEVEVK